MRRIRCVVRINVKRRLGLDLVGVAFSLPNLSATSLRRTNRVLIAGQLTPAGAYRE